MQFLFRRPARQRPTRHDVSPAPLGDSSTGIPVLQTTADGLLRHHCMAWVPNGILERKLAGFITGHGAKLVEITNDRARLRLGTADRLSWRGGRGRVPVELTITLHRDTACIRSMTHITADFRLLARRIDDVEFQSRSVQLIRHLRYSLMAKDLERRFAERSRVEFPLRVWAMDADQGEPDRSRCWQATAHDLSTLGLTFHAERSLVAERVWFQGFPEGNFAAVTMSADIVRRIPLDDHLQFFAGRFVVEAPDLIQLLREQSSAPGAASH